LAQKSGFRLRVEPLVDIGGCPVTEREGVHAENKGILPQTPMGLSGMYTGDHKVTSQR
jgi:hypothetical protein